MAKEIKVGCGASAQKEEAPVPTVETEAQEVKKEEVSSMVLIGKPAPDFAIPAYHVDKFTEVKLSDYKGKWVLVCFYPGDFTFV